MAALCGYDQRMKKCRYCNADMPNAGAAREYCSDQHRVRAHEHRKTALAAEHRLAVKDGSFFVHHSGFYHRAYKDIVWTVDKMIRAKVIRRAIGYRLNMVSTFAGELPVSYPYIALGKKGRFGDQGRYVRHSVFLLDPFERPLVAVAGRYALYILTEGGFVAPPREFSVVISLPACTAVTRYAFPRTSYDAPSPIVDGAATEHSDLPPQESGPAQNPHGAHPTRSTVE